LQAWIGRPAELPLVAGLLEPAIASRVNLGLSSGKPISKAMFGE
jgi:hypothetical protein